MGWQWCHSRRPLKPQSHLLQCFQATAILSTPLFLGETHSVTRLLVDINNFLELQVSRIDNPACQELPILNLLTSLVHNNMLIGPVIPIHHRCLHQNQPIDPLHPPAVQHLLSTTPLEHRWSRRWRGRFPFHPCTTRNLSKINYHPSDLHLYLLRLHCLAIHSSHPMHPIRGYGPIPSHHPPSNEHPEFRNREYMNSTPQDDTILDPVSALLRAGEIVNQNSRGRSAS